MRARSGCLVAFLGAVAAMVLLAVPAGAASGPVWAGTWNTGSGPLEIKVSGNEVTGRFGYADSWNDPFGQIKGTISGNTLSGTWWYENTDHAPLDHGPFTLTYSIVNAKKQILGTTTYAANGTVTQFLGQCTAGPCSLDTTPPLVKALVATGAAGAPIALRYLLTDDSNNASETVTVMRGSTVIWRKTVPLHGAFVVGSASGVSWNAPKKKGGALSFTVVARDAAGNVARSSAVIRLR